MTETLLQRTWRMKWLWLCTPHVGGWRLQFSLRLLRHFSAGVSLLVAPFCGEEESDISLAIDLGWLEIMLGAENNPY